MPDPRAVFRDGAGFKQKMIETAWPELYAALAPATGGDTAEAPLCAVGGHRERSAGRLSLNGPPACADCLRRKSRRPGGYPLGLTDPRKV